MPDKVTHRERKGFNARIATFRANQRGATLIEFAFVAAPFIALMIAILETSLVYFSQEALETAAEAAARSITTGAVQTNSMSQSDFLKAACKQLPTYLSCNRLMVDIQTASSFDGVSTTNPTLTMDQYGNVTNSWNYQTGGAGDIVVMRLMYLWPVSTGPLGFNLSNAGNGQRLLVATTVAKTEPY